MAILIDPSSPLTLAELMGSIMSSVIEAQAQSARTSVEFIESVGLVEGDPERNLRNVQFRYKKLDEHQEAKEFVLEMPLLGMVHIPLINVKSATFSFTYEITDTESQESTVEGSSAATPITSATFPTLTIGTARSTLLEPAILHGRILRTPRTPEAAATVKGGLKVNVELEQAAPPVGIERILDILEVASSETKEPSS